ncbi:acyl--CoA ligase [Myxococcota bacterium]|nr:acyl--CoA ligase [Myxococcota bacterium]
MSERSTSTPPRPRASVHYPEIPFHGLLERAADQYPEAIALLYEDERFTFRELDGLSNSLARALRERSIGAGDRVVLYCSNRPEWIIAAFGILKAGASAVLISSALKLAELRHAVELTGPKMAITGAEGAEVAVEADLGEGLICVDGSVEGPGFWDLIASQPGQRLGLELDPETHEAVLCMSSGTTGLPKAVRHAHRSLCTGALQWKIALGMGPSDRLQTFTPLSHILGLANVAAGMASGAAHRLFSRFDLDTVLRNIEEDRITIGIAVAPVAMAMADHPDLESFDLSSLRYFNWCATPVTEDVANRFTQRTGVRWLTAYGATEAPVLSANPVEQPKRWRLDTPGLPGPDCEMRIVDLETHEPVPPGESGEVVVRGPNVMLGYLPEEANADAFLPGGWYRTGDVGWMEEDGWLHLTDRVKEMIKVSGFQVAPAEIESILLSHPGVADCAVFGAPHDVKGQVPHAAVVRRATIEVDESELVEWSGEQLANYKRLMGVEFVEEVPRTASGKALRRVLLERFNER